jgi:uncharacterized phage-associated protein
MHKYPFDIDLPKAIQAISVLLNSKRDSTMDYKEILRLLYSVEREILQEKCYPFIGDQILWTVNGPVMKTIYELCQIKYRSDIWDKTFNIIGNDIKLIGNASVFLLSKFELKKIQEIAQSSNPDDPFKFKEWIENKPAIGHVKEICFKDILKSIGRETYEKEIINTYQTNKRTLQFFGMEGIDVLSRTNS